MATLTGIELLPTPRHVDGKVYEYRARCDLVHRIYTAEEMGDLLALIVEGLR